MWYPPIIPFESPSTNKPSSWQLTDQIYRLSCPATPAPMKNETKVSEVITVDIIFLSQKSPNSITALKVSQKFHLENEFEKLSILGKIPEYIPNSVINSSS